MAIATMTSKGQITIPANVRAKFRLRAGTKIDFYENEAGELVLRPKRGDVRDLRGLIKHDGPPLSIEEMNQAIGKAAVEQFKRSVR